MNVAGYINEAMESVLAQTFSDFELIIVDGGSNDGTWEIVQRRASSDSRILCFKEPGMNMPASRNFGIGKSKGDLLAFVDGDDLYEPKKLEEQLKVFESDPGVMVCHTDAKVVDNALNVMSKSYRKFKNLPTSLPYEGMVFRSLLFRDFICMGTMGIRKEILGTNPFDDSLQGCEDWDLWVRLARKYKFGYVPQPLYLYRSRGASVYHSFSEKKLNAKHVRAFSKWLEEFKDVPDEERSMIIRRLLRAERRSGQWKSLLGTVFGSSLGFRTAVKSIF